MENKITSADLGFDDEVTQPVASTPIAPVLDEKGRAMEALSNAVTTAALKASIEASADAALRNAEKTYVIEKKRYMLNKCVKDARVPFRGNKLYAQYFGKVFTFLYNCIPVVVKFDGSVQYFPKFIYDRLMEKINEVLNSNVPGVTIEDRREKETEEIL